MAYALQQLQHLTGSFRHIHAVGPVSKDVATFTQFLMRDRSREDKSDYLISDLLLLDRDVDMVSALLSQLTYEGVLDEVFGIECGAFA